jgi:aspartyl-tRNA(Asn)/glutamyl-tRNA(Gln) amidotransferase subunit A
MSPLLTLESARIRIREREDLGAFISLTDEEGDGPIVGVKDLVDVRGTVTTGGGIILPPVAARDDAPVIRTMRRYDCVVIGKTNLHEWAFGVTSTNPHYGPVRNPHDLNRIPGGSSGGSAAAVAAEMCDWAVGSDTGGSIRVPAGLCGVVGIKPTLGSIPTEGVIPLSRTLDTLGPLAPDVRSAARALEMMTGRSGYVPTVPRALDEYRLGVPAGWVTGLDEETETVWRRVSAGIAEVPFVDRVRLSDTGREILFHEAADFHRERVEQFPELFGEDVLRLLRQGLEISEDTYISAIERRLELRDEASKAMDGLDALVLPATASVAPLIGDQEVREQLTRFTRPFNTTGQPVVTVPAPVHGLPVGVQVVGRLGDEATVIEVALALETAWSRLPA